MSNPIEVRQIKANIPPHSRILEEYEVCEKIGGMDEIKVRHIITMTEGKLEYHVDEPSISHEESKAVSELIKEVLSPRVSKISDNVLIQILKYIARKKKIMEEQFPKILYYVYRDIFKYGIITPLVSDSENIEDILCNGPSEVIYVMHRKYGRLPTNLLFNSEEELNRLIIAIIGRAGKTITRARPFEDIYLEDGRFAGILGGEVSAKSSFTFRLRPKNPLTLPKLIDFGTINPLIAAYLWLCAESCIPIIIAGGMSSGKTTLANAILAMLPPNSRIITVEDTPELQLPHANWIQLYPRSSLLTEKASEITLSDLLRAALRHSGDYLVVGEVREKSELDSFFKALATGMGGVSTIHANNVLSRLRSIGVEEELFSLLKVHLYLTKGKDRRYIYALREVVADIDGRAVEKDLPLATDIDELIRSSSVLKEIRKTRNLDVYSELTRRSDLLKKCRGLTYRGFLTRFGHNSSSEILKENAAKDQR
jgi:flagellar protein FlaI